MALFEKFRDKAMNLAGAGMSKAMEVGEIAKLNLANASEEENIKKAYMEIGKRVYEATSAAPDAAYADQFQKIAEARARIAEAKARIAELKADDDCCDGGCCCCEDAEVPPEEPQDPAK